MFIESDQKESLKSEISQFIDEYSEKDFDHDKFYLFLFTLFEEAQTMEQFQELCLEQLKDFFGDNTENFVTEVSTHISFQIGETALDHQQSKTSYYREKDQDHSPNSEDNEDYDDIIPDDEDDDKDTNYKRRKNLESSDASNLHIQRQVSDTKKDKEKLPKTPPTHPMRPPQLPGQPAPERPWPWPQQAYPPAYMYPPQMGYMPPPFGMYPPMIPPMFKKPPEGKPSDYDPLNPMPKDVRPPSGRPQDSQGKRRAQRSDDSEERIHKVSVGDKDGKKTVKNVVPISEGYNPKTTIYVKNIPEYYNTVEALHKQFKRFGVITNVRTEPKNHLAIIEFKAPKSAKMALTNKPVLFGKKEIFITGDPNMTQEDEVQEQKKEDKLLEKLRFLIEIKKYVGDSYKNAVMQKINEIKNAQKSKEVPETLVQLIDSENFDLTLDSTLMITDVPDKYLENKQVLHQKLESFGKVENYKVNPKTKIADFKYFNLTDAQKAYTELSKEVKINFMNEKVWDMLKKIEDFEGKFLTNTNGKANQQESQINDVRRHVAQFQL